jgi:hypothetical protein
MCEVGGLAASSWRLSGWRREVGGRATKQLAAKNFNVAEMLFKQ